MTKVPDTPGSFSETKSSPPKTNFGADDKFSPVRSDQKYVSHSPSRDLDKPSNRQATPQKEEEYHFLFPEAEVQLSNSDPSAAHSRTGPHECVQ